MTKRIAHFIDTTDPGGAEVLVGQICERLKTSQYEPLLIHFGHPLLGPRFDELGIEAHIAPAQRLYASVYTLPFFTFRFAHFLKRHRVQLLHSHLFAPVTAGAMAAFLAGIPHIGTLHDTYTIDERPVRMRLVQLAACLGTRMVAVARSMEEYFTVQGGVRSEAFCTIYNGVEIASRSATGARDSVDRLVPEGELTLICVARLVEVKCHQVLLDAFAQLSPDVRTRLLLVGDGPLRQPLEEAAKRLGLAERVIFLGMRDDVPELLRASDVFVLSSRSEGLSCSVAEAMASGLPAVVTDVGGNHELIENGVNGYLVPEGNVRALSEKLALLLCDQELRARFGHSAFEKASRDFSLDRMFSEYFALYDELLDERSDEQTLPLPREG